MGPAIRVRGDPNSHHVLSISLCGCCSKEVRRPSPQSGSQLGPSAVGVCDAQQTVPRRLNRATSCFLFDGTSAPSTNSIPVTEGLRRGSAIGNWSQKPFLGECRASRLALLGMLDLTVR